MEIVIQNYVAGSFQLESNPESWDVIVILDSDLRESRFVENHSRNNLLLRFDDITSPSHGKRAPSIDDIKAAIQFSEESDRLMVCCRAGQSRSAAIAFSIAFHKLGSTVATKLLDPKRHAPNSLVVDLASSIIDDPMFLTTYHEWQTTNRTVRIIDHVDELEREMDTLELAGARNRILEP